MTVRNARPASSPCGVGHAMRSSPFGKLLDPGFEERLWRRIDDAATASGSICTDTNDGALQCK